MPLVQNAWRSHTSSQSSTHSPTTPAPTHTAWGRTSGTRRRPLSSLRTCPDASEVLKDSGRPRQVSKPGPAPGSNWSCWLSPTELPQQAPWPTPVSECNAQRRRPPRSGAGAAEMALVSHNSWLSTGPPLFPSNAASHAGWQTRQFTLHSFSARAVHTHASAPQVRLARRGEAQGRLGHVGCPGAPRANGHRVRVRGVLVGPCIHVGETKGGVAATCQNTGGSYFLHVTRALVA